VHQDFLCFAGNAHEAGDLFMVLVDAPVSGGHGFAPRVGHAVFCNTHSQAREDDVIMAISSLDRLATVHSLESTGLSRAQAERIADTVLQSAYERDANLVTKHDLTIFRAEMKAELTVLLAEMKAELTKSKADLFEGLWQFGGCLLLSIVALLVIFTMLYLTAQGSAP